MTCIIEVFDLYGTDKFNVYMVCRNLQLEQFFLLTVIQLFCKCALFEILIPTIHHHSLPTICKCTYFPRPLATYWPNYFGEYRRNTFNRLLHIYVELNQPLHPQCWTFVHDSSNKGIEDNQRSIVFHCKYAENACCFSVSTCVMWSQS